MTALIDAATRGFARGFVALLALGVLSWALDRILGSKP